jgi:hypothetical protein
MGVLVLLTFQIAPTLRLLTFSGFKKRSPNITVSQSPRYMNPLLGTPTEPLWRELPISRAFVYIFLKPPFVRLSNSPVKEPPSIRYPNGAPFRQVPVFRDFLYMSFRVASKKAPIQIPLAELSQRKKLRFKRPPSSGVSRNFFEGFNNFS